jgi:hypothetical protein
MTAILGPEHYVAGTKQFRKLPQIGKRGTQHTLGAMLFKLRQKRIDKSLIKGAFSVHLPVGNYQRLSHTYQLRVARARNTTQAACSGQEKSVVTFTKT